MKKHFLLLLILFAVIAVNAQGRGIRIAYIDMEYILEKVPDYAEAKNLLEQKAQKWKQEIEVKRNEINKLKDGLKAERVLLTKELILEREEEITFLENDLLAYQEKRFGPKGDLISQKSVLVKPIQDQVFTAVQDISEAKNFDFVFDKSSDLTMLFAAQRHDISEQVIRRITRSTNREQLSRKQLKELEAKEAEEDLVDENPEFAARQKRLEERKMQRDSIMAERKTEQDRKRQEAEDRRERLKQEREDKKNGVTRPVLSEENSDPDNNSVPQPASTPVSNNTSEKNENENKTEVKTTATDSPRNTAQEERERKLQERKQALEDRRNKILADREAAKKAREEEKNRNKEQKDE